MTPLDQVMWMAEEWIKHIGLAQGNADEYRQSIEDTRAYIASIERLSCKQFPDGKIPFAMLDRCVECGRTIPHGVDHCSICGDVIQSSDSELEPDKAPK